MDRKLDCYSICIRAILEKIQEKDKVCKLSQASPFPLALPPITNYPCHPDIESFPHLKTTMVTQWTSIPHYLLEANISNQYPSLSSQYHGDGFQLKLRSLKLRTPSASEQCIYSTKLSPDDLFGFYGHNPLCIRRSGLIQVPTKGHIKIHPGSPFQWCSQHRGVHGTSNSLPSHDIPHLNHQSQVVRNTHWANIPLL